MPTRLQKVQLYPVCYLSSDWRQCEHSKLGLYVRPLIAISLQFETQPTVKALKGKCQVVLIL